MTLAPAVTLSAAKGLTRTGPDGAAETWQYDPLSNPTDYTYDLLRRLITTTYADPDGEGPAPRPSYHNAYNAANELVSTTDPLGRVTSRQYDGLGRMTLLTLPDPDGPGGQDAPQYSFQYDVMSNLTQATDPLGRDTTYDYDALGRLLLVTNALGGSIAYAYDAANRVTSVTDTLGRITNYAYDGLDRLYRVILPDPDGPGGQERPEWNYSFDANNNVVGVTDPMGGITLFDYDILRRMLWRSEPNPSGGAGGPTTYFEFDEASQLVKATDPMGQETVYTRDNLGRVIREAHGADEHTDFTFDAVGNLLSVTDALGNTTAYTWDNLYRLVETEDPEGGVTTQTWDLVGNLTSLTDPVGNTTSWVYDHLDRAIQETNELGHARYFTYDLVGNLTAYIDRNGRRREFDYDALNRRVEERWLDGQTVVRTIDYQWDAAGQLTAASDPDSSYQFTYDGLGRVVTTSNAGTPGVPTVELAATYDALGRRTQLAAAINGTADFINTYVWDGLSRMTSVRQSGQQGGNAVAEKRVDFAYNALGQFTAITRYADLAGTLEAATSTFAYNDDHRLTDLVHAHSGTTIAAYAWTYDDALRVTTFVSPEGTSTYSYDQNGQLVLADHDYQPDEANTFDANGNRTGGGYVVGPNNRISSDGTFNYEYDNEGNLVRRTRTGNDPADDYVIELEWDHRNRLTRVVFKNSAGVVTREAVYTYDVFDRRIGKSVDWDGAGPGLAEVERFVYDGMHIVLAFNGEGSLTHRYLHGPPPLLGSRRSDPGRRGSLRRRGLLGAG